MSTCSEERDMDARFEAHQDRVAEDQEQAEQHGFAVGDNVTVGKGKASWTIVGLRHYLHGGWHAHLETADGYAHTTVHVDRLRAAS